jgi:coenzyme PQQ biosynthesis protein C
LFSPKIISERVSGMLGNYDFITEDIIKYFGKRLTQAPRDSDFALDYVRRHALRHDQQESVLNALFFKCDVLWAQLDALWPRCQTEVRQNPQALDAAGPGADV